MNLKLRLNIFHDDLVRRIKIHGKNALDSRQVAKRLRQLLPARLFELKRQHSRSAKSTRAMRLALADPKFEEFINECVDVTSSAFEARVQHETHLMLVYARQSLRAFRRGQTLTAKPPRR